RIPARDLFVALAGHRVVVVRGSDQTEPESQRVLVMAVLSEGQNVLHRAERIVMPGREETIPAFAGIEPLLGAGSRHREKARGRKSHRRVQLALACFPLTPFAFLHGQVSGVTTKPYEMTGLPTHRQMILRWLWTLLLAIRTHCVFPPPAIFFRVTVSGIHLDQRLPRIVRNAGSQLAAPIRVGRVCKTPGGAV